MEHTPEASEVGCSINLVTGEHYGPCRGSCGPDKEWEALARFMGCNDEQAKVMLAATELLSALEGIYRVAETASLPGPVPLSIAEVEAARAAIKAAKGDA